ncbi:hypothetical protein [Enterovibrio norvegicus]|uniref:Uncharacterized protein n=1 Tax=Enterovibrio norvegicus TaxID=188144 RepID=A0A2N7L8L2_9GAMM|nr:hypothetical protein [Enterovibrio norvegicus]PMN90585.1 hypothetical protein BCT23_19395 [Enterovibrio norvegicus]
MKRYLVVIAITSLISGVIVAFLPSLLIDAPTSSADHGVSHESGEKQGMENGFAERPMTAQLVSPESTGLSSASTQTLTAPAVQFELVAPQSDTLDALDADIAAFAEANVNVLEVSDERDSEVVPIPTFVDVDLTLWRASESAKSVFENYTDVQSMDEKHFIEFDDTRLDSLAPGQRFSLPAMDDERIQVIVKSEETWNQGVTNWELVDNHGHPAGSITQMQDSVEAVFTTPSGQYFLRSVNGVGWIASEETLISALNDVFTKPEMN